ncbi:alpha/beta fold hydrolase [Synechococcus sp. RSCCF101]|nr:alpha/beta fold hydrolase [Synechococcus sp. RSCCF101]
MDWGEAALWQWRGWQVPWRCLGPVGGPALLLLHGFGASSGHWRALAPPLAAMGWRVFALDLIGFGGSSQPARPLDNRLWGWQVAAFLRQVIQPEQPAPVVLMGNSLGALVGLTTAVLAPARVRGLVAAPLPDPALVQPPRRSAIRQRRPGPGRRRIRRLGRCLVRTLLRLLPLELLLPVIVRTPLLDLGLQSAYSRPVGRDRPLRHLIARPASRRTAAAALRGMTIGMTLRPRWATAPSLLPRLRCPLLLLWGRRDRLVPPMLAPKVEGLAGGPCRLALLDGGHCLHDDVPGAVLRELEPWLQRLPVADT